MKYIHELHKNSYWTRYIALVMLTLGVNLFYGGAIPLARATSSLPISQVPLTMSTPQHAQVLIAIGNSQSMDGDLSGAIMTGSGALSSALASLANSSSPVNYTVPAGFTPPVQAANSAGQAPYTVNQSGILLDNGASRLNVAKQGVQAILQAYMQDTDFALEEYSTSGTSRYTTWVYYMSPQTGPFTFTNTYSAAVVNNPCANYTTASSSVKSYCTSMVNLYGASALSEAYMQIGATSDAPNINDVLYAGGLSGLFVTYNGPNPSSPYPPNFTLSNYNNGSIYVSYNSSAPNNGGFGTSPTNAGYVPYSPQVMYAQRGFGYYVQTVNAGTGTMLVPMTTAGTNPTASSVSTAIANFTSSLQPETDNSSSGEIKALAYQSPLAGLLSKAKNYLVNLPSSSSSCAPQKYVVLISDGLPTMDLQGLAWPPLGSAAAAGYNVTASFNTNGSLNTTNDQALTDTINTIAALKTAGIKTYIVGLGAGVNATLNPAAANTLTAMAMAGGTSNFYAATSPSALVSDLNSILVAIQNGSFSTSASAVNSTIINSGSVTYQATFTASDTLYQDWTGNLIASSPLTQTPLWSAQKQLDILAAGSGWANNRYIATWTPALNGSAGAAVPFEWSNISAAQQTELQPGDNLGQSRLNYLRGDTSQEQRNGGAFRNRTHLLGDIVDSQPLYIGAPNGTYFTSSYFNFETSEANRTPVIYVGANDGMLHAFNANNGNEMFAFVPNAVFANLINLTAPLYNQSHQFFVDGSPNTGDVQFSGGTWHTVLVGGENAGGNSIYALDVTNPQLLTSEALVASHVLWEFTDGDMGLSYSQPQIAPIAQTATNGVTVPPMKSAVFFGNGYNSPNNNAVLYALNPQTGAVISKINLCTAVAGACNATIPEGLSTVAVANSDGLLGMPITTVYAGDLQGNLWAIDVSSSAASQWSARLLFSAQIGGVPQPITTPPVVTLNPNYPRSPGLFVMFGTGQLLTASDLTNTQTQTAYGIWDDPAASNPITLANLVPQTLTPATVTTPAGVSQSVLTDTTTTINWANQMGWYDNFPTSGQRLIVNPLVSDSSFVASLNTPPASCNAPFTSITLDINYQNGGAALFSPFAQDITAASNTTLPANIVGLTFGPGYQTSPFMMTMSPNAMSVGATVSGGGGGLVVPGGTPMPPGCTAATCHLIWVTVNGVQTAQWVPWNQAPRFAWWQIQ